MWVSRKEFEKLRSEVASLRNEYHNEYRILIDLFATFRERMPDMINEYIGIKVIDCARDEIELEVFNKLKDKLFGDRDDKKDN